MPPPRRRREWNKPGLELGQAPTPPIRPRLLSTHLTEKRTREEGVPTTVSPRFVLVSSTPSSATRRVPSPGGPRKHLERLAVVAKLYYQAKAPAHARPTRHACLSRKSPLFFPRDDRIRTCDLTRPRGALYQAELHPDARCIPGARRQIRHRAARPATVPYASSSACAARARWLTAFFSSSGSSPNVRPRGS
jgi:hypothetical protein